MKGKLLSVAVITAALTLCPRVGVKAAYAEPHVVQQQQTITGTVVDDKGEPIIGATVLIVGGSATQGAVTDFDGNFKLNVKPGTRIKISYIGFEETTVTVSNNMRVQLKPSSAVELGGVEVVAYGVQKKVTVTGALSSVKSEDLVRTPVSSVNNILAGQLSGVTTVQYSGEPGSDAARVYVRGQGTWTNSEPLIQVDGVERTMGDIDPEDIESITVLKDASATAVFGVRGANGVVLITTKRGSEGKAKIDITTSFSALTPTKMVEQASSYQYATFYNQMQLNDFDASSGQTYTPMFSDAIIEKFKDGSDPIRFPSTKWADYTMKDVTLQTKHNVNISGGTKNVRYFVSAGYMSQGGLFKEFEKTYSFGYQFRRFNYRANLDLDVTKTTVVSFNVAGNVSDADRPLTSGGSSGLMLGIFQATPFSSPGLVDGKPVFTTTDYLDGLRLPYIGGSGLQYYSGNPGYIKTNLNKLQMDLQLVQKLDMITKGLSFKIKGSYNSQFEVIKTGDASNAVYYPMLQDDGTMRYRKDGLDAPPTISEDTNKGRDWYFETSFNYNRTFGDHTVTGLLLYNQSKTYYPSSYSDIPSGYVGLVGRLTYDYRNKYMAEFNIGYNGSENFHPDRRFGTFPAGSVGWVVSDEGFFKPIKKIVSFLKLRASWGLVGNDKIGGSRFMYLADPYTVGNNKYATRGGYAYNFGIENSTMFYGAYENSKNNPNVSWEKAFKQDYGIDVNFLQDRLRLTADYYKEHRTGILLRDGTAPSVIGFSVPYANLGIVDSWGYELSFKWNDQINRDFRYWLGVNLSYNQNEIKEMKEAPYTNEFQYQKGHRIGARYMYKFFRFYDADTPRLYEEAFGQPFPTQLVELKDGDAVFVDLDGDGKITPDDRTRDLGRTDDPTYMFGLNMGCSWKNWEFNAQWTGAWGVSRMLSDVFRYPFLSRTAKDDGGLLEYHVLHTWDPNNPGQNYEYPRATWKHGDANNYQDCALYEKDAKYLRLKTLMIGYNMKFGFFRSLGLDRAQLAFSGYNLLTFTPYLWGDPETRASSSPSYPLQRTFTVSLKLNF